MACVCLSAWGVMRRTPASRHAARKACRTIAGRMMAPSGERRASSGSLPEAMRRRAGTMREGTARRLSSPLLAVGCRKTPPRSQTVPQT